MRKIVLSREQKRELAELMANGLTRSQARWEVLTPKERRDWQQQSREAKRKRYAKDPCHEIIEQARRGAKSRGAKLGHR